MKIKTAPARYEDVAALPPAVHQKPRRANFFFRTLMKVVSELFLASEKPTLTKIGMDRLGKDEPCIYLMNHSCFIDLPIAASMIYPRPFSIVATSDSFVGKDWLMRQIGCIPTQKFVPDLMLIRDMLYAVKENRSSIVMYPEASYSFDGTATPLPDTLAHCLKKLGVPLVMIRTDGAFLRDPLYNNIQVRKVHVTAEMEYLLSAQEIAAMSTDELTEVLQAEFTFDNFRRQQQSGLKVTEPFRADYLHRVLYKCPHCLTEGETEGKGIHLTCKKCGKQYELTEDGFLKAVDGDGKFDHIPDWYRWEREEVREEILSGTYGFTTEVDILMLVDTKCVYRVGTGTLSHNADGFTLTGCDGKLTYTQSPQSSYSLYADYNWYEIGDVICIGTKKVLYYCIPKDTKISVAKARLASEELYKIVRARARTETNG